MTDSSFNEVEVQNRIRERWTYFGYLLAIYGFLATTYLGLIIGIALEEFDWNQRISTGMIYLFTSFTFLYIDVLFTLIFGLISMLKKNFQLLFWFAYINGIIELVFRLIVIDLFFVVVVFFDEKSSNVANGLSL